MVRRKYLGDPRNAPGAFYVREGVLFTEQPRTDEELQRAIAAVAEDDSGDVRYGGDSRGVIARIRAAQGGSPSGCDALELDRADGAWPARIAAAAMRAIPATWLRKLQVFAPKTRKDAK